MVKDKGIKEPIWAQNGQKRLHFLKSMAFLHFDI